MGGTTGVVRLPSYVEITFNTWRVLPWLVQLRGELFWATWAWARWPRPPRVAGGGPPRTSRRREDPGPGRRAVGPPPQAGLAQRLRPEDPRGHRRLWRLPVRGSLRLPGSSQRQRGGRHGPDPRALRGAGQGLPLRANLSFAGEDGRGRPPGGGLRGHRRPQPRPALRRRAEARKARGLCGAGRVRLAGRRPAALPGREGQRPEVHDVRDLGLPRRLPRHAADLPCGRVRQTRLQRGRIFALVPGADPLVPRLARRAAAAMVSHALQRLLRVRQRRQLHRGNVPGDAQPGAAPAAGEQPLQEPLRHGSGAACGPARAAWRG